LTPPAHQVRQQDLFFDLGAQHLVSVGLLVSAPLAKEPALLFLTLQL